MSGLAQMLTLFAAVALAILADWVITRVQLALETRRNHDAIRQVAERGPLLAVDEPEPAEVLDPESLEDSRPDDIDVCNVCSGEGAVMYQHDPYLDEWDSVECWVCNGTGELGAAA
jgi:hypothetical protein